MKWSAKTLFSSWRTRGTNATARRRRPAVLWVEALEDRLTPSTANIVNGVLEYTAAPNEVNNVTVSPVVFGETSASESNDVIITDLAAVINVLGGTIATDWLKGLNVSLGAGIGFEAGPVEVSFSVSFGFPLIPAQIPGGAVLAPFGGGSGNIYSTIVGGLSQNQSGAAVIAGSALPASQSPGGNVYFQVGQNGNGDTITNYQLYQAVVDPNAVLTNVTAGHGLFDPNTPDLSGSFADFGGNNQAHFVAVADQFDNNGDSNFYKIHLNNNERVVVIMDNDPTNSGTPASTRLALLDSSANAAAGFGPGDETAAVNLSAAKGNAIGSLDLAGGNDYYLQVSNFGFSTKKAYRFVVLEYDQGPFNSQPNVVGEPGNGIQTSTSFGNAQGLGAGQFGTGAIAPVGETDTWSAAGDPNQLVFAYADTHSASGQHSLNSSLTAVASDQTTTVASATSGGPPGANPKQVQNVNSVLAGIGLSPSNQSATSMDLDFTRTINAAKVDVTGIGANVKIHSGSGGVTATLGTGMHNTFLGDTNSNNTDVLINNSNTNNETAVYGGGGHNVLMVPGDQSSNNFTLAFHPPVVQANATKDGYTFANGYEELDVTVNGTVSTYLLNTDPNGVPDVQEVQVVGDVGNDNLTVLGHANLAEGVSFDGKGGQNTLIVHDGDAAEDPNDTTGHLDILRLNKDRTSGSVTIGGDAPVVFTNVQTPDVTPFIPLLNPKTGTITGSTGNDREGRLVVFNADPFEPNDGILNATNFNFLAETNAPPNIDQPNAQLLFFANQTQAGNTQTTSLPLDQDWYRFQAPQTGTYTFTVSFDEIPQLANGNAGLPVNGQLDADVFDATGNPVASGVQFAGGDTVTFSANNATGPQTYYLRVRGHDDGNDHVGINNYQVSVSHSLLRPQVSNVYITGHGPADPQPFNLFGEKPTNATQGPTPLVNSLTLSFMDQPPRAGIQAGSYPALDPAIAANPGEYLVVGDNTGIIPVSSVIVNDVAPTVGNVATATVTLVFAQPLPDDRYTVTIRDSLLDPSGNALAGGSNASQPNGGPTFPSGLGNAAADFVGRFTVDSRPELGVGSAGTVYIDLNENFAFDPVNKNNDQTNADKAFFFGIQSDTAFAGRFAAPGAAPTGFSKIGAYGRDSTGQFRWLLDTNDDGVADYSAYSGLQVDGFPVAGEFGQIDPNHTSRRDTIGLFDGNGAWYLDTNGDNNIETGDQIVRVNGMRGYPDRRGLRRQRPGGPGDLPARPGHVLLCVRAEEHRDHRPGDPVRQPRGRDDLVRVPRPRHAPRGRGHEPGRRHRHRVVRHRPQRRDADRHGGVVLPDFAGQAGARHRQHAEPLLRPGAVRDRPVRPVRGQDGDAGAAGGQLRPAGRPGADPQRPGLGGRLRGNASKRAHRTEVRHAVPGAGNKLRRPASQRRPGDIRGADQRPGRHLRRRHDRGGSDDRPQRPGDGPGVHGQLQGGRLHDHGHRGRRGHVGRVQPAQHRQPGDGHGPRRGRPKRDGRPGVRGAAPGEGHRRLRQPGQRRHSDVPGPDRRAARHVRRQQGHGDGRDRAGRHRDGAGVHGRGAGRRLQSDGRVGRPEGRYLRPDEPGGQPGQGRGGRGDATVGRRQRRFPDAAGGPGDRPLRQRGRGHRREVPGSGGKFGRGSHVWVQHDGDGADRRQGPGDGADADGE